MNAKHTPGPWLHRRPLYPNTPGYEVNARSNGVYKPYIADIRSIDATGGNNSEANARLIAAAPDLLAALEAVLTIGSVDQFPGTNGCVVLHQVRAAIVKAKG